MTIKIKPELFLLVYGLFWLGSAFMFGAFNVAWWVDVGDEILRGLILLAFHATGVIGFFMGLMCVDDAPQAVAYTVPVGHEAKKSRRA